MASLEQAAFARKGDDTTQVPRTSLLDQIGRTPLLRLERVGREFAPAEFYAKAEWFNPGGSVKDRAGLSMIQAGLASGALRCLQRQTRRLRTLQT